MALTEFFEELRQGVAIARNDPRRGLERLQSALERAKTKGHRRAVKALATHAAVIATHLGELEEARRLYDEALFLDPSDARCHLAIAHLSEMLNDSTQVARSLGAASKYAHASQDAEVLEELRASEERLGWGPDES